MVEKKICIITPVPASDRGTFTALIPSLCAYLSVVPDTRFPERRLAPQVLL